MKNAHYIVASSVKMIKTSVAIFDISMPFWYDKNSQVFLKGIINSSQRVNTKMHENGVHVEYKNLLKQK